MKKLLQPIQRQSGHIDKKVMISGAAALVVIVIGLAYVIARAAGLFSAVEAESGTLATNASVVNDNAASGGKAIQFKEPTVTPTPTPTPTPTTDCTKPVFTTSDTNGGWSDGGYYVHNNMWNASSGETLYACSYKNWYVEASGYSGTEVRTYPNVHLDLPNAFTTGVPYSKYSTMTTTFAGKGPGVGIYDVAYDLWLNGVGWGNGTTEVMIWTEYIKQRPLGSIKSQYVAGGVTYDVWHYNDGNANVVSYVARGNQYSGTIDLKSLLNDGISKKYIPANPTLNQFGYGIEYCDTGSSKARFTVSDFSITLR